MHPSGDPGMQPLPSRLGVPLPSRLSSKWTSPPFWDRWGRQLPFVKEAKGKAKGKKLRKALHAAKQQELQAKNHVQAAMRQEKSDKGLLKKVKLARERRLKIMKKKRLKRKLARETRAE